VPEVSDEALVAYYEVRDRAEQRFHKIAKPVAAPADGLRDEIETWSRTAYQERLGDLTDLVVGEVGIGNGDFALYAVQKKARRLVLIDISRDRLVAAGETVGPRPPGRETKLIAANAQSLAGVDDGELDLLVAKEMIEHLKDYRPFLAECRRVIRPGGRLFITTPNRACVDLWLRNALTRVVPKSKRTGPALIGEIFGSLREHLTAEEATLLAGMLPAGFKEHIHEFAPGELVRALTANGFRTVRRWGSPPQMFYHELRPVARRLLGAWSQAEHLSYVLGDHLFLIAERSG
jgi:ubiquinone/menaquinone biosynthesis C-methylase UbiE